MKKITFNSYNERIFERVFSKSDIERILYLFSGRNDIYAEEIEYDINNKKFEYKIINNPLSQNDILLHLSGKKSIMYYPIDNSLLTNLVYIYVRYHNESNYNINDLSFHLGLNSYNRFWELIDKLNNIGIKIAVEYFKDEYLRLIIILKEKIHFLKSIDFSKKLMQFFYRNGCVLRIEPCHLTEVKIIDWKEVPIPIPLGIIPNTNNQRRLFINHKTLSFYEDQMLFLCKTDILTEKHLFKKLNEESEIYRSEIQIRKKEDIFDSAEKKLKHLREKCKVIDFIISKTDSGIYLSEEEKKILYYTLSFLSSNYEILRRVLSKCINFNEKTFNKHISNLYPRPISCPKIRELIPNIVNALDCNCIFDTKDLQLGRYPSPILHINPLQVPTLDERYTSEFSTPKELATKLFSIIQEINQLELQKNILQNEIKKSLILSEKRRLKINNTIFYITENNELKIENI